MFKVYVSLSRFFIEWTKSSKIHQCKARKREAYFRSRESVLYNKNVGKQGRTLCTSNCHIPKCVLYVKYDNIIYHLLQIKSWNYNNINFVIYDSVAETGEKWTWNRGPDRKTSVNGDWKSVCLTFQFLKRFVVTYFSLRMLVGIESPSLRRVNLDHLSLWKVDIKCLIQLMFNITYMMISYHVMLRKI